MAHDSKRLAAALDNRLLSSVVEITQHTPNFMGLFAISHDRPPGSP
jgi:hypothetical protein